MENNIHIIRKQKGLTLRYLSYASQISVSYLSMLERNKKKNPTYKTMREISQALEEDIKKVFYE